MEEPLILLKTDIIKQNIVYHGKIPIKKLEVFDSIDSTSSYLQRHPVKELDTMQICLAEQQTAGHGRLGRAWYSPFAANIYLSCGWRTLKNMRELSGFSLAMSLAITDALTEFGIKNITIKWPNDILWREKKLAGILLETKVENPNSPQMVLSVGLNVNMPKEANQHIDQQWAAINTILGSSQDRNKLVGLLITHILKNIEKYDREGFSSFINRWKDYDHFFDKEITLYSGNQAFTGIAKGVNSQGYLLLQHADGHITAHSSGDTSTKKLNSAV